jgi:hypothetical protein
MYCPTIGALVVLDRRRQRLNPRRVVEADRVRPGRRVLDRQRIIAEAVAADHDVDGLDAEIGRDVGQRRGRDRQIERQILIEHLEESTL